MIQARDGRGFVQGNKCYVVENNWILGVFEGKPMRFSDGLDV